MKICLEKIWKYIAVFFAGVIAALVYSIRQFHDQTIINTDSFIASQEQKIGKLKQRGEGNTQNVSLLHGLPSRKERRLVRRSERRELRLKKNEEAQPKEKEQSKC
jgi:hypothetical protein